MPLRSVRLIIADIIATTGCCPMDLQAISCLRGEGVTSLTPSFRSAVHGSFVPYALAFHIGFSPSLWPDCHLWLV